MVEAIIGFGVVAVLLALGFYFTRGGGGMPGGLNDPAAQEGFGRGWSSDPHDVPEPFIGGPKQTADGEEETSQSSEAWQRERERYRQKDQTRDS